MNVVITNDGINFNDHLITEIGGDLKCCPQKKFPDGKPNRVTLQAYKIDIDIKDFHETQANRCFR